MVDFVLQISDLVAPVCIKYIPSISFTATRGRPEHNRPLKPPGKNWAKSLEKRRPESKARKVKALSWDRHEKNIFPKISDHRRHAILARIRSKACWRQVRYDHNVAQAAKANCVRSPIAPCPGRAPTVRMDDKREVDQSIDH
jgi:hypothetical protein